jgi:radical SAM protein with 4Fe4S-binding SPASM domain
VTNATLLTPARVERFARRPTDLIASIDGATAETFEAIRRPARFERVIESLRLYQKVRDIYPEAGSTLGINFVAMRRNIEELPALVDLAAELGAQFISVLDFATGDVPPEIAAEHLAASPELANRLFDQAAARAAERGIQLHLPLKFAAPPADNISTVRSSAVRSSAFQAVLCFFQKSLSSLFRLFPARRRFPQQCPDPWTTVLIATDGRVHPCCVSRRVMGDLTAQSAEAIWNGPAYRRFRRRIRSTWVPPECRSCNTHWGVNAGNPSAVRAREGLLIKGLYRIEEWWLRTRRRLSPPPQPPPPNYAEGREKNVHESHESTRMDS